jgi:hypothetical protein
LAVVDVLLDPAALESGLSEPVSSGPAAGEPESDPDPASVDEVLSLAGLPDSEDVFLDGFPAADGDGSAAKTGAIATSPTTAAASGNRNRRCIAASSLSCIKC